MVNCTNAVSPPFCAPSDPVEVESWEHPKKGVNDQRLSNKATDTKAFKVFFMVGNLSQCTLLKNSRTEFMILPTKKTGANSFHHDL